MKNFKNKFIGMCGALMVMSTLTGCGKKTAKPNFDIPEGGFDTEKPVEIMFYNTMGTNLTPKLDAAIEDFQAKYPNITVKYTAVGGWDDVRDQIATEIAVGAQPNLAYCYPDHVALYNKAKAVITLDNLIYDDQYGLGYTAEQIEDFIPGYWEEGKVFGDGLMYTIPFSKSTEVLYYNETMFTKLGLAVPDHWFSTGDDDKTSMEYACATLKAADPTSVPLGYDSEANWFITMCEQMNIPYTSAEDGGKFLFNNQEIKDVLLKLKEWYSKGWMTTQKLYGSYTSGLFCVTKEGEQKSYMSIGSSAGATYQRPTKGSDGAYPFNVGIAEIPQANPSNKKVICQGPSICIFKNEDPQKVLASWLFLRYLTTDVAFQADFGAASGYVPVLKSVQEIPDFKAKLDAANGGDNIAYLSMKVCLGQTENYFVSPAFVGSSAARDQAGALLQAICSDTNNEKNIDALFADAIAECEYQRG